MPTLDRPRNLLLAPSQYPAQYPAPQPSRVTEHPRRLVPAYLLTAASALVAVGMVWLNAADNPPFLSLTVLPGLVVGLVGLRMAVAAWRADWERAVDASASRRCSAVAASTCLALVAFFFATWTVADRPDLAFPQKESKPACLDFLSMLNPTCYEMAGSIADASPFPALEPAVPYEVIHNVDGSITVIGTPDGKAY